MRDCIQRILDCVVPTGTTDVYFDSSNGIYLINYNSCSLQDDRETVQKLNTRFNFHRFGLTNPVNMVFDAFYQAISSKEFEERLHIQSQDWKK